MERNTRQNLRSESTDCGVNAVSPYAGRLYGEGLTSCAQHGFWDGASAQ